MSDQQPATSEARPKRPRDLSKRKRGSRDRYIGIVVSTKMQKTITVSVERTVKHPKYEKYMKRHTKVYAHDERGQAKMGDVVRVVACRPMSKLKRFVLTEIVKASTREATP